jgi:DNA invertase Pin-like site-specific DNA recombinase
MRVAVYARYSSENQKQASIDDQIEVCKRCVEKQGWVIVRTFSDAAESGASRFRPGYQSLLASLDSRDFDVIVVEALDRLGRKLADVAALHDRCAFAGVKLYAVHIGEIGAMHIGMLGTMAQLYLSDLREKTWRGQLGRALQGKIPGGKAYGYDLVPGTASSGGGERRINEAEAPIVRRIFRDFAAGESPRAIAKTLNAEGVPGPGGRPWGDTTIRGQVDRGTGLLNNAVYVGRLEWNRCGYLKDPRTGKRVARPNPMDKWEVVTVPELRIVDDELWEKVKARQSDVRIEIGRDAGGNALNRAHRRRYLLSGLLECGACGGGYTIVGPDHYGCATRRSKGTCSNALLIRRQQLEERVLGGLKDRMLSPDLVTAFVEEFNAEVRRRSGTADADRTAARKALADVERKIAGILRAIEDGAYNPTLTERLTVLEREKTIATAKLKATDTVTPIRLHPNLPDLYRRKVAALTEALNRPDAAAEAGDLIRGLIDRVVLTPADGALRAELRGDLATLAAFAEGRANKNPGAAGAGPGLLSVVAGIGFEPMTFRL